MGANTDKAKGKVKEEAGKMTGNRKLEDEGKVDQAKGKTQEAIDKTSKKLKESVKNA